MWAFGILQYFYSIGSSTDMDPKVSGYGAWTCAPFQFLYFVGVFYNENFILGPAVIFLLSIFGAILVDLYPTTTPSNGCQDIHLYREGT